MKVIIITRANKRNTPATRSFRNKLSDLRCMKYSNTAVTLTEAIRSATATEKLPKLISVTSTDNAVSSNSVINTLT